nr:FecR domain-containing protein [uncultured Bacteroides sp.]
MMKVYTLISKYFSGTASLQEIDEVNNWRKISEANENEFQELRETWKLAHFEIPPTVVGKERVWERITKNIAQIKPLKMYSRNTLYRVTGIAAMIALLIGFSLPLLFQHQEISKYVTFRAPSGQKAEVNLPDGTTVLLNSGSSLTYATDYSRTNRSVKLDGQAFFDVAKDLKHPFDVSVGNVKVLVHGTAFDVNGYSDNRRVEVALLRGHVSILSAISGKLLADMRPDQKAIISSSNSEKCLLIACDAEEETLWHLGKLKIQNEELTSVIHKMERWYGVKIHLNNPPLDKRYWMTVKTESFKEMLEIINRITPITYSINGEEVTITCRQ